MKTLLERLVEAGSFEASELHMARALDRRGGSLEADPFVSVAAAAAARAPRIGRVCVELDELTDELRSSVAIEGAQLDERPWPDSGYAWRQILLASPIARDARGDADDAQRATPLVVDEHRLYLDRYFRYEMRICTGLQARIRPSRDRPDARDARAVLGPLIDDEDGSLERQQLAAVSALAHGLTLICGGPGTGKTTTVTQILITLVRSLTRPGRARDLRIALAAPTGKAAARMRAAIAEGLSRTPLPEDVTQHLAQLPTFTLHRLLGTRSGNQTRFRHHRDHPLAYDVVIVDEASMISLAMMARLLDAIPEQARLILLGDRDQLASVDAGAVFGDVCPPPGSELQLSESFQAWAAAATDTPIDGLVRQAPAPGIWDCAVTLNKFHRFDPHSGIGHWTRAVQQLPDLGARSSAQAAGTQLPAHIAVSRDIAANPRFDDFSLRDFASDGGIAPDLRETIIAGFLPMLEHARAGHSSATALALIDDLRVLCPHREGVRGVSALNQRIESWLAQRLQGDSRSLPGAAEYYIGRPIMVDVNDYDVGLYNGDVGIIVRDPTDPQKLVAAFSATDTDTDTDTCRHVPLARLPPCTTVYAMSVHKSQGSQFAHVLLVLPEHDSPIMTRELVYTAVTRARRKATILGDCAMLDSALARRVHRPSGLRHRIWRS